MTNNKKYVNFVITCNKLFMNSNKNLGLYSLIIIPLLLVIVVFGVLISISNKTINHEYNFVYQIAEYSQIPDVIDGKIVDIKLECDRKNNLIKTKNDELANNKNAQIVNKNNEAEYLKLVTEYNNLNTEISELKEDLDYPCKSNYNNTKYFIHDTRDNFSRQVSIEELNKLDLINSKISPDGYKFFENYYGQQNFDLFSSNSNKKNVLVKDQSYKEQNLTNQSYGYGVQFIAWYKN